MHLSFALSLYIHIKYLLHDDMHSIVLMYWTHVCEQTWETFGGISNIQH